MTDEERWKRFQAAPEEQRKDIVLGALKDNDRILRIRRILDDRGCTPENHCARGSCPLCAIAKVLRP